jgi:hypothetical protein
MLVKQFVNGVTEGGASPEASLSYDGQYVMSGELRSSWGPNWVVRTALYRTEQYGVMKYRPGCQIES